VAKRGRRRTEYGHWCLNLLPLRGAGVCERGRTLGGYCVGVARVAPILSADMGYVRRGLQEGERGAGDGGWIGESSMVGVVRREWL